MLYGLACSIDIIPFNHPDVQSLCPVLLRENPEGGLRVGMGFLYQYCQ